MRTRWPFAGFTSSQTLRQCDPWSPNIVMCPKTIFPVLVAGAVAAKALHRAGCEVRSGAGTMSLKRIPSIPFGVASRADSSVLTSVQALTPTMSTRSRGRPSKRAPAAFAPSAIPFISRRYSSS